MNGKIMVEIQRKLDMIADTSWDAGAGVLDVKALLAQLETEDAAAHARAGEFLNGVAEAYGFDWAAGADDVKKVLGITSTTPYLRK